MDQPKADLIGSAVHTGWCIVFVSKLECASGCNGRRSCNYLLNVIVNPTLYCQEQTCLFLVQFEAMWKKLQLVSSYNFFYEFVMKLVYSLTSDM